MGSSLSLHRPAAPALPVAVNHFLASRARPRPPERRRSGVVFYRAMDQPEAEVLSGAAFLVFRAAAIVEARIRAMEHVTEGAWESLQVPLHPRVLSALRELGFPHMTPVQVLGRRGSEAERSAD